MVVYGRGDLQAVPQTDRRLAIVMEAELDAIAVGVGTRRFERNAEAFLDRSIDGGCEPDGEPRPSELLGDSSSAVPGGVRTRRRQRPHANDRVGRTIDS